MHLDPDDAENKKNEPWIAGDKETPRTRLDVNAREKGSEHYIRWYARRRGRPHHAVFFLVQFLTFLSYDLGRSFPQLSVARAHPIGSGRHICALSGHLPHLTDSRRNEPSMTSSRS